MFSTADKIYFGLQLVGQLLIAVWIALYHFKHEQAARIVAVLTVVSWIRREFDKCSSRMGKKREVGAYILQQSVNFHRQGICPPHWWLE